MMKAYPHHLCLKHSQLDSVTSADSTGAHMLVNCVSHGVAVQCIMPQKLKEDCIIMDG